MPGTKHRTIRRRKRKPPRWKGVTSSLKETNSAAAHFADPTLTPITASSDICSSRLTTAGSSSLPELADSQSSMETTPPGVGISASKHKLLYAPVFITSSSDKDESKIESAAFDVRTCEGVGCRIIVMGGLSEAVAKACTSSSCKSKQLNLAEDFSCRQGLVTKLMLVCKNCGASTCIEYQACEDSKHWGPSAMQLNRKLVCAARYIGRGRSALETFSGIMDLPPPLMKLSFSVHAKRMHKASAEEAEESMRNASKDIHASHDVDESEVCDVCVSHDGTWMRRGYSSLYGVTIAISQDNGKVLDYTIMCKNCYSCRYWATQPKDTNAYQEWKANHVCDINYEGSAPAMEAEGALMLWQRSVEQRQLRYTQFVGDGDSKAHKKVATEMLYGQDHPIVKLDCVGNIQKRVGSRLRSMKKRNRGRVEVKGETVVLSGRGGLTDSQIDMLQSYYGIAIRSHTGDLEGMQQSVKAIARHRASTDEKPMHELCPPGPDSWCGFQRDLATGLDIYKHHNPLPLRFLKVVVSLFEALLRRCVDGYTQNVNESLNGLIWKYCPKESFAGRETLETAVAIAVCHFNDGAFSRERILSRLGVISSPLLAVSEACANSDRVRSAEYKCTKKARKQLRRKRKGIEEKNNKRKVRPTPQGHLKALLMKHWRPPTIPLNEEKLSKPFRRSLILTHHPVTYVHFLSIILYNPDLLLLDLNTLICTVSLFRDS